MHRRLPPPGAARRRPELSSLPQQSLLLALPLNPPPRHKLMTQGILTRGDLGSPQPLTPGRGT
eukprot:123946-Heterocapsa_arctica.AAC.1